MRVSVWYMRLCVMCVYVCEVCVLCVCDVWAWYLCVDESRVCAWFMCVCVMHVCVSAWCVCICVWCWFAWCMRLCVMLFCVCDVCVREARACVCACVMCVCVLNLKLKFSRWPPGEKKSLWEKGLVDIATFRSKRWRGFIASPVYSAPSKPLGKTSWELIATYENKSKKLKLNYIWSFLKVHSLHPE